MNAAAKVSSIPPPLYNEDDPATQVFVCPLCCDLSLKDPTITPCQHIFCRECIATALIRRSECPVDRRSLRLNQVSRLSGPLNQIWLSLKVQCPKCTTWSGTLERYESHVLTCKRWDEDQIKRLEEEAASTARANRALRMELSTVNEKLAKTLKRNKQLEKEVIRADMSMKNLKADYEVKILRLTQRLADASNTWETSCPTTEASNGVSSPIVAPWTAMGQLAVSPRNVPDALPSPFGLPQPQVNAAPPRTDAPPVFAAPPQTTNTLYLFAAPPRTNAPSPFGFVAPALSVTSPRTNNTAVGVQAVPSQNDAMSTSRNAPAWPRRMVRARRPVARAPT